TEALAHSESEVARARTKLDEARRVSDGAKANLAAQAAGLDAAAEAKAREAVGRAEAGTAAAEKALEAAWAGREAVKARISVGQARYAAPPDSKAAQIRALVAGRAERVANLARSEANLAKSESERAEAAKLAPARQAVQSARAAVARLSRDYTSLTPVYPATSTGRRLALARWMVARENPLAARGIVNHVWMRHSGRPLVESVFDFGLNGKPPSHPELLDWLAVELMDRGWSLKAIHRRIVTSAAYRLQSSGAPGDSNAAIDPRNVYLWRMNPRRL